MGGLGSGKGLRKKARRSKKLNIDSLPGLDVPELIKRHRKMPDDAFLFSNIRLIASKRMFLLKALKVKR